MTTKITTKTKDAVPCRICYPKPADSETGLKDGGREIEACEAAGDRRFRGVREEEPVAMGPKATDGTWTRGMVVGASPREIPVEVTDASGI